MVSYYKKKYKNCIRIIASELKQKKIAIPLCIIKVEKIPLGEL